MTQGVSFLKQVTQADRTGTRLTMIWAIPPGILILPLLRLMMARALALLTDVVEEAVLSDIVEEVIEEVASSEEEL